PAVEALVGEGQEFAEDEFRGGDFAHAGPVEGGVEAVAGGAVEVLFGGGERHAGPDGPVGLGEHADDAVVEGAVGDDVGGGRPGGQHAVLDAQVGAALHDGVDGAVPAVDGPVVEGEFAEFGDAAGVEDLAG